MSRNEAAERLRRDLLWEHLRRDLLWEHLRRDLLWEHNQADADALVNEALATERWLTVKRVRERLLDALHANVWNSCEAVVVSILDDLATADVDEEEGK